MGMKEDMHRSGFDILVSCVSGMRGPLGNPGKTEFFEHLYVAYIVYVEFAVILCWLTIGYVFVTPSISVEVRCMTGFPMGTMTFSYIRRVDMYLKRDRYKKLMEEYLSLYDDAPALRRDVANYAKIIRNIPKVLFLLTTLPLSLMDFIPIFVALLGGSRVVGIPSAFPFDPTEYLVVFCTICLIQTTAANTCTLRGLSFENMFNMFACRQLALNRQLSRELARILSAAQVNDAGECAFHRDGVLLTMDQAQHSVIQELEQWIKNHQKSIRMAKDLQDMYSISLFIQFAFTGVLLITSAFVMANAVGGMLNIFFCGLYVIGLLVELLITCRLGELILYESDTLDKAVDGSHAYILPSVVYNRWIRFILTRARVPTRITALGVFPLVIETYKSFILSTYSFFTLLKEMKKD